MEEQNIDFKKIIRDEYMKCAMDPNHFMKKYCKIQHPTKGKISFQLYPFQEKVLAHFQKGEYCIVNKSRQLGISTLVGGYALWLMLFHQDKNVLCIATKQNTAKNMVTKVRVMYEGLPSWLQLETTENNKLTLSFKNGSIIKATSAASDAGRSEAASLLIIDEAAFIEGIREIWASSNLTLATGGQCIAISTPYGTGNWFHETFTEAESGDNSFLPIKLPWFVHPERDQAWRDEQDKNLKPHIAAQECDANFLTSGDTVFHSDYIEYYEKEHVCEPVEKRGNDGNLWIFKYPDFSRDYLVVVDSSRGDAKDYSGFHVFDIETNEQVSEYKGKLDPKELALKAVTVSTEYNMALLVIEANNIGWNTVKAAEELGYKNLYYSPKGGELKGDSYHDIYDDHTGMIPGFTTSLKNRPILVAKGQEYISLQSVIIHSKRLMSEMKVFIWKNGRAQAQSGYNDDLVLPFCIAMFLRDTAFKLRQQNIDLAKQTLGHIQKSTPTYTGGTSTNYIVNPYKMPDGKGGEMDINWLL